MSGIPSPASKRENQPIFRLVFVGNLGVPRHIRSDNGPEFTSKQIRRWLNELGAQTLFIERGSPWQNGYVGSFNGKMRDELLNREIFYHLEEAQVLIEAWRREYNPIRPHRALGDRPPGPEAIPMPALAALRMGQRGVTLT